jgi:hypothetical protein
MKTQDNCARCGQPFGDTSWNIVGVHYKSGVRRLIHLVCPKKAGK